MFCSHEQVQSSDVFSVLSLFDLAIAHDSSGHIYPPRNLLRRWHPWQCVLHLSPSSLFFFTGFCFIPPDVEGISQGECPHPPLYTLTLLRHQSNSIPLAITLYKEVF